VTDDTWLVVGLGNPGPSYVAHRHNAGFLVADLLADRLAGRFKAHKGRADICEGRLAGRRIVLMKPKCYMNDSGGPVAALSGYFAIPTDRMAVIHDELDLPYGSLRLKVGGGDSGHNGLRSVRKALGSGVFARVRFGIGRPPGRMDPADFVLRNFSAEERKELAFHVDRAADAVQKLIAEGLTAAQNAYNS
jgi:PTH1 family peptidyl-tRNA hydrolase